MARKEKKNNRKTIVHKTQQIKTRNTEQHEPHQNCGWSQLLWKGKPILLHINILMIYDL